jgi:DNA polymerase III epsilon subunit-like protein
VVEFFELAVDLPEELSPHRATYDALVTARLFQRLASTAGSLAALRGIPPGGGEDDTPALF